MTEFDSLPLPMRNAIQARDVGVKPLMETIDSLDGSWAVVGGNLRDLSETIAIFAGPDTARTLELWHRPPPIKHKYHLRIVRLFHNYLSSAVAHLHHLKRANRHLKRFDSGVYSEFCNRHEVVAGRLELLVHVRDFSIHKGAHQSVLTLRHLSGQFRGEVGFATQPMLTELELKTGRPRSRRERASLQAIINQLKANQGAILEIAPMVNSAHQQIDSHRTWCRKELLSLYERLSNHLARWASPMERPVIDQYFVDNPIPVHNGKG